MAASVAQFAQVADWFTTSSPQSVTGLSWSNGDKIIIIGGMETAAQSINTPTNANLTIGLEVSQTTGGALESPIWIWSAVAGSAQSSQTIQATSTSALMFGLAVIVITGTDGTDANGAADLTESAFTFTPTAGSVVIYAHMDWNVTTGKTQTTASGTPTERRDAGNTTNYSQYIGTWENVTATSQSWGITDYTGTQISRAAIEVKAGAGTVNGSATVTGAGVLTASGAASTGQGPRMFPGMVSRPASVVRFAGRVGAAHSR